MTDRLSLSATKCHQDHREFWMANVHLDGRILVSIIGETEDEARLEAQKYTDDLIAHFRAGGK